MVRTWNRDPSPDLRGPSREAQSPKAVSALQFSALPPRFAYDGKVRIPNFLNGYDGQLLEARARMVPTNTATHTSYDFSRDGTGNLGVGLAADVSKSMNTVGTMRSTRSKSATVLSLLVADTRYDNLDVPYKDHVGPGAYAVERGSPGLGTLPLDSHVSSAQPPRDPYRQQPPFLAPERPASPPWLVRPPGMAAGADAVYISPQFVPSQDHTVPWDKATDSRPDAADWRLGHARAMATAAAAARGGGSPMGAGGGGGGGEGAAGGGGAGGAGGRMASDAPTDCAGRAVDVALRATQRNPHGPSFSSKEARLLSLPPDRTVDVRAARHATTAGPGETAHLGPGAYAPATSPGGPRRRTYRLFVDPAMAPQPSDRFMGGMQADAAALVHAAAHGSARAAAIARLAGRAEAVPGGRNKATAAAAAALGGPGSPLASRMGASAAFASPFRSQRSGPFSWSTDSTLVRH
ncbi:hypothetical protein HYH03_016763 [Edaphochlamys debaryana]|uniref:Uncharacterized protein n=1 Tax=Edaphochlamys debaryana TaxID=47281 RepID=A0A836BRA5_9CHLO|nr:hypothetical protein HYH03_016763 [Edaphochlamys debaryana]|eukprot:KAG2484453.1 hypothetical protein HYH03_016763 [Edaphochlamys debaryana]